MNDLKQISTRDRGFSLIEVILAIAVFGLTIVAVIGLLGPTAEQVRDLKDLKVANGLPGPVREELNRLGFDYFVDIDSDGVGTVNPPITVDEPVDLFGTEDGSLVSIGRETDPDAPQLPPADRYFLVEVFLAAPVDEPDENLSYDRDPADAYLAFRVNISWPYHLRTGTGDADYDTVAEENRQNFEYYTAIVVGEPF